MYENPMENPCRLRHTAQFQFPVVVFFFNLQWYLFSFAWLIALWILILLTIKEFSRISKTAAALMIPYLLWVTFAGYLNLGAYLLNS